MAWAPDYTTLSAFKAFLRVGDTVDDSVLSWAITAASRMIDKAANRQFGKVDDVEPRYFTARWDTRRHRWAVRIDDLHSADGLLVAYDSDDDATYGDLIDEYRLHPVDALRKGRVWTDLQVHPTSTVQPTALQDGIEVRSAYWGWPEIPDAIVGACHLQASRLVARRDSPYGIAGSPDTGSELRLLAKLDPDVDVAVRVYWRPWGAV